jgi:hypothetical protein
MVRIAVAGDQEAVQLIGAEDEAAAREGYAV